MQPFWLVWCEKGNVPIRKHETRVEAEAEAERLARKQPGDVFIILQAVQSRCVDNMVKDYVDPGYLNGADVIPFWGRKP